MPLVEGVGGPILPVDCQDQNHKRQFMSLLLQVSQRALSYPNDKEAGAFQGLQAMAEMALMTVEGACQLLMVACDRPPSPLVMSGQPP
jgi:hypothetical protein